MAVYREIDGNIVREYRVENAPLFQKQTEKALVEVVPTLEYGRCLFIDNELQLAEKDEYIYHESLVHPCLMTSVSRKKICIFGGGDGCAAREVLKWSDVEHVCILDWDSEVTTLFQDTYSEMNHNALKDSRITIENKNIQDLLHETRCYDCILVDLLDPNQNEKVFWKEIFDLLNRWLDSSGSIVINAGGITPWQTENVNWLLQLLRTNKTSTPIVYKTFVPSFGREWCFILITKSPELLSPPYNCDYFNDTAWNNMRTWTKDYLNKLPEF